MSRSGYDDDIEDNLAFGRYRGQVASATRGKRGQEFFKELVAALDAMPEKRLIAQELEDHNGVCALGALARRRGLDVSGLDPEDAPSVASKFGIAEVLAREVVFTNDEMMGRITPEARWEVVRTWAAAQIKNDKPDPEPADAHLV